MSSQETFTNYLTHTRLQALRAILTRAKQSNHLAKILAGVAQKNAYTVKYRALSEAIALAPEVFSIDSIQVGITGPEGFRFHVPLDTLSPEAREILAAHMAALFTHTKPLDVV
jgi:hypothetical protein